MLTTRHPRRVTTTGAMSLIAVIAVSGAALAQPMQLQPAKPTVAAKAPTGATRLPPIRPAGLGLSRSAASGEAAPIRTAAAEPDAARPTPTVVNTKTSTKPAAPATQEEAVERLNSYFNSFSTLQSEFIQFASDGRRFEGKLYIQRPGKMRFEYRPPVTMEVVADGKSVAVKDTKLATQDLYSIGQTPLKFLVKDKIDLGRDSAVVGVSTKGDVISVRIEDRSTLGGTSKITLNYDYVANELRQWVVVDPQGYETTVSLYNIDTTRRPDPKNFVINYERVL